MAKSQNISSTDLMSVFNSTQYADIGASEFSFYFKKSEKPLKIKGVYPVMSWTTGGGFVRINLPLSSISERKLESGTREITTKYETVIPEIVSVEACGRTFSSAFKDWDNQIQKALELFKPSLKFRYLPDFASINIVFHSIPEFINKGKKIGDLYRIKSKLSIWRYYAPGGW
jgi:hypothetical protein